MNANDGLQGEGVHRTLIGGLLSVVDSAHADMAALVRGVDVEGLKWMPAPGAPHLSGLVLHVLQFEDYLARIASGEQVRWEAPLGSSNALVMRDAQLLARIAATGDRLRRTLETITPALLDSVVLDDERTVGEALTEDISHASLHLGQMQLTRQLMVRVIPMDFPEYVHWA